MNLIKPNRGLAENIFEKYNLTFFVVCLSSSMAERQFVKLLDVSSNLTSDSKVA